MADYTINKVFKVTVGRTIKAASFAEAETVGNKLSWAGYLKTTPGTELQDWDDDGISWISRDDE